jgi:hypothetical protein
MISPRELALVFQTMLEDEDDHDRERRGLPVECHHRWPNGHSALVHRGFDRKGCASGTCAICGEFLEQ